jgi:hypothetical protein
MTPEAPLLTQPFELITSVPPAPSEKIGVDRGSPEKVWELMEQEGDVLARIGDSVWYCVFPRRPYVEEEEGTHIMLCPRPRDGGTRLGQLLLYPDLQMLTGVILREQIESPNVTWGFNDAPDPKRKTAQTWLSFHAHVVVLPDKLAPAPVNPLTIGDAAAQVAKDVLTKFWQKFPPPEARLVDGEEINNYKFPFGGVLFSLGKSPKPLDVAMFIQHIRGSYGNLHAYISNLFLSPGEWIKWIKEDKPNPRINPKDTRNRLIKGFSADFGISPLSQKFLTRLSDLLEQNPISESLIRPPSYSLGFIWNEELGLSAAFAPRIKKPLGVLELLGIKSKRHTENGVSLKARYERAVLLAKKLAENAQGLKMYPG